MTTATVKGKMDSAYGQTLTTSIPYSGEYTEYETIDEVKTANDWPSNDEILAFVNTKRKNNARQSAMNEALSKAGIVKPTLEDTPELQIKTMVKSMVASGKYTEEKATELAKQILGL